ncbi:hypothetical protein H8E88_24625 [candidate division KSB1 bacterium]|nr:hypothetical protein [candidate division KSB1 bacterium]
MFKSPASHRGIPPPFHFSMDWLEMRCPWCRKRPFLHQHKFMGTDGKYYGNVHECNYCPRNFTTASGLAIHTKTHERKDAEKERSA